MQKKTRGFWEREYRTSGTFTLSNEPSDDLIKFTRFLERRHGRAFLNVTRFALDIGCGNGRNLLHLARTYAMRGMGYDLSREAIEQAHRKAREEKLPLTFAVQDIRTPIPLENGSCTLVMDMMASHVLRASERENLRAEIIRVVRPDGWLLFKSFLLEEDTHAKRLLREHPGPEEGMYLHPEIGTAEYVWPHEGAVRDFFEPAFTVHKIEKSFKHQTRRGVPWKRRSITAYLEKAG